MISVHRCACPACFGKPDGVRIEPTWTNQVQNWRQHGSLGDTIHVQRTWSGRGAKWQAWTGRTDGKGPLRSRVLRTPHFLRLLFKSGKSALCCALWSGQWTQRRQQAAQ